MRLRQSPAALLAHPHYLSARRLIEILQKKGYASVLAGGCVRDGWLGRVPKDLDIATAAPPEVVETSFARTLPLGKAFGTMLVVEDGYNFEVTTFRKDGPYVDGRHPSHVEFSDMEEDAKRRDFTVNALFFDPEAGEIIDFVGGIPDLEARRLRTVGVAEARFREDYLRLLRASRFVAQLGFELDSQALQAAKALHEFIREVASERVLAEMKRLLTSPHWLAGLKVLRATRLSEVIWPEMGALDLEGLSPPLSWENAFAAVMLRASAHSPGLRLRAWKAPRESLRRVERELDGVRLLTEPTTSRAARALILGDPLYAEILNLAPLLASPDQVQAWINEFLRTSGPLGVLPKPWLNGEDLVRAGIAPGEKMGQLLKALYAEQIEGRLGSREEALARLDQIK